MLMFNITLCDIIITVITVAIITIIYVFSMSLAPYKLNKTYYSKSIRIILIYGMRGKESAGIQRAV